MIPLITLAPAAKPTFIRVPFSILRLDRSNFGYTTVTLGDHNIKCRRLRKYISFIQQIFTRYLLNVNYRLGTLLSSEEIALK